MGDTLVFSRYSGIYRDGDDEVEVNIFRPGNGSDGWTLEVVNSEGTSILWEAMFATDDDAYKEFLNTVKEEGLDAFAEVVRLNSSVH
jgi:hypothetical protein